MHDRTAPRNPPEHYAGTLRKNGTRRIRSTRPLPSETSAGNGSRTRKIVLGLTERGVHVRFEKEHLTFTGEAGTSVPSSCIIGCLESPS